MAARSSRGGGRGGGGGGGVPRHARRLARELQLWAADPIDGVEMPEVVQEHAEWRVVLHGAPGSLYEGETYTLRVRFSNTYPLDPPEIVFLQPVPVHEHVYSVGHLCLSVLADDYSPALTVRALMLSIQSMLSSAERKMPPEDDQEYSRRAPARPKDTRWDFHDDRC